MAVINAQDLKILGVSVIETALANDQTAIISNGASQFVVMTVETYRYMLECELLVACAEGRADIAAGNFSMRTPEEHLEKLKEWQSTPRFLPAETLKPLIYNIPCCI